ncbi:WS/DGAT/MGAT family O-acyltransferase [Mycobacterium sp.]|uniref:WS/DGAT/MGAT family O-acyltransferase n=1 Tax=Mycobacterium sp. TaxID=1785 RepID=UPI003F9C8CE8
MAHLTPLDAAFLEAEDSDPHVSLAIGVVAVVEGPIPDYGSLVSWLGERMLSTPRFKQVLRTHPLDLGPPEWIEDVNLDLSHHLHRAALPHPGDDSALFRLAADVMERRLDRDRPMWECWIIEGLTDDRWAILTKIHHCIGDGVAVTHILAGLFDDGDASATDIRPTTEPAQHGTRLPQLSLNPLDWVSGIWHASADVTTAAARAFEVAVEIAGGLLHPAPVSSLMGPVTNMRRYSAARVSLRDVAKVRQTFDVTINDVALAAITDSFRATLIRRGEQPRRNSLRTLVPVSVRSNDALDKTDNRVSLMLPYLPVEKADPAEQLRAVHARLARTKASGQRQAGSVIVSAANLIPFPLTAWTVRALARLPQRAVVTVATNVPGPRQRLQVMGHDIVHLLPIPPIALRVRTGIAIFSYADDLVFGIIADYDAAPDVDELAQGVERAVARLVALSAPARRSKRALKLPAGRS